jgi:hypothetical protein
MELGASVYHVSNRLLTDVYEEMIAVEEAAQYHDGEKVANPKVCFFVFHS